MTMKYCNLCEQPFAGEAHEISAGRARILKQADTLWVCRWCLAEELRTARAELSLETGLVGRPLERMLAFRAKKQSRVIPSSWLTQAEWEYRYPCPIPFCPIDGPIRRAGVLPRDDEDRYWGFIGLCIRNPIEGANDATY